MTWFRSQLSLFACLMVPLIAAIAMTLAVRHFVVQAYKIPSTAMRPTLQPGDHVLVNKYVYRFREPARGDVVVFVYPGDRSKVFIKRVIAVGGESVEIHDKHVLIDGKPLDDPWGVHKDPVTRPRGKDETLQRDNFGPVRVPPGSYFVLGDDRDYSHDSRFWGFVPREDVRGRAFVIYWSKNDKTDRVYWERIGMELR